MAQRKQNHSKNPRGTKKKGNRDKIHGRKKGKKGEAAAYMTRAQALAKLQVSLADFRRLCILKGIYPRDPKKKSAGNDKTYYHNKDILFLGHEPLLNKFFEMKTFMKKFKRLMGRNERTLAAKLEGRKPEYTLHHLVRERYPSLEDAVRDLDDGVSMLALFASLSADQKREIPPEAVNEATRLYQEFQLYVIRAQALRKCFASIKGYYFQAEINGQTVTWLAPHQFAQDLPPEVDFKVMLTFLEFYRAMVKFVNFKLYADLGLEYPPKRNKKQEDASAEVAALETEMREAGEGRAAASQGDEEGGKIAADVAADFGDQSAEALEMQKQVEADKRMKTVFRGLRVFINREVPLRPFYFTLLCGGVTACGWERGATAGGSAGPGSAFPVGDRTITHQVVDRPPDQFESRPGREYVQPQWVFDTFNTGILLPIAPYAPGRAPPPHLSPFVNDTAEGYIPRQREILDKFCQEVSGAPAAETKDASGDAVEKPSTFDTFNQELKAEQSGKWHSEFREEEKERAAQRMKEIAEGASPKLAAKSSPKLSPKSSPKLAGASSPKHGSSTPKIVPVAQPTEAEEERNAAKAMMPKKHKRLLQRIEGTAASKAEANAKLAKKRKIQEKQ